MDSMLHKVSIVVVSLTLLVALIRQYMATKVWKDAVREDYRCRERIGYPLVAPLPQPNSCEEFSLPHHSNAENNTNSRILADSCKIANLIAIQNKQTAEYHKSIEYINTCHRKYMDRICSSLWTKERCQVETFMMSVIFADHYRETARVLLK